MSTLINGTELTLETGKLARQANSVLVTYGETTVLGTSVIAKKEREGFNFFPLKIDFDEKFYAAGRIKGSRFIKRETRPAEEAVLIARAIDRTIRPLFPKGFQNEAQVILTVLSYDGENSADMVAAIAACACLSISEAPFTGPVGLSRIGLVNDSFVFNPTHTQRAESSLDIIVGSLEEKVVMIEAGANEIPEDTVFKAIEFGMQENKKIINLIADLDKKVGKEKMVYTAAEYNKELYKEIANAIEEPIEGIYKSITKMDRQDFVSDLKEQIIVKFTAGVSEEELSEKSKEVGDLYEKALKDVIRKNVLEKERRVGGRSLDQIRPLFMETGLIPRVHGSGLFQRGETQGLTITTLGGPGDAQLIDNMEGEQTKTYMHHYNFPPFSVGDISTRRFTGNREIGHGFLAEKALIPVLPSSEDFPYTMRLVTEILESNGSSSMAATCGSTLSLMDAGVPIKRPVSGIAMGLMTDKETGVYKVLTDLQDIEDFGGDMDFKVTGTSEGITAIQVDMKIQGLTFDIIKDALEKSKTGRMEILEAMLKVIPEPKADLADTAPRITSLQINPDLIKVVIGKGGETINKIIKETGVDINIEDTGFVTITSTDSQGSEDAINWIKDLTREIKVGEIFEATVVKIMDFGAFVRLVPGKDALCHFSQLAHHRVEKVEQIVKEGDILKVKVMEVDERSGKIGVSHKVLLDPSA